MDPVSNVPYRFVTGSKDQLYNGSPAYNSNIIVERAGGDAIFVAMNYRVRDLHSSC